jgi:hypothetical protein
VDRAELRRAFKPRLFCSDNLAYYCLHWSEFPFQHPGKEKKQQQPSLKIAQKALIKVSYTISFRQESESVSQSLPSTTQLFIY